MMEANAPVDLTSLSPEHESSDFVELKASSHAPPSFAGVDVDMGEECPICLENFTKEGSHKTTATKCGHLFGYECIYKVRFTKIIYMYCSLH